MLSALIVAAAIVWAARQVAAADRGRVADDSDLQKPRVLMLLQLFAPAIASACGDPRLLIAWQPIANGARQLYPAEFARLDAAFAGTFPFTAAQIDAAHARWTAEWLAWERAHDAQYKMKAIEIEHQQADPAVVRARLDSNEREKLELYQRKYEEYIRVARTLQAMAGH